MDRYKKVFGMWKQSDRYLIPFAESTDSTTPQIIKNATAMEGNIEKSPDPTPSLRERKKSITFNENVERIEIEAEVPVTVSSYQF